MEWQEISYETVLQMRKKSVKLPNTKFYCKSKVRNLKDFCLPAPMEWQEISYEMVLQTR